MADSARPHKLVSTQRPAHRLKFDDTSRAHVLDSVERSLRELRTDRLDVLLIHRPDALLNPIVGSRSTDAMREAVAALDITLSAEEWYAVWEASIGREVALA